MPRFAWRKSNLAGISRFVASKARRGVADSPLIVQAGFPTSVADLVVKNRSRLRKTPRWIRRQFAGDGGKASTRSDTAEAGDSEGCVPSPSASREEENKICRRSSASIEPIGGVPETSRRTTATDGEAPDCSSREVERENVREAKRPIRLGMVMKIVFSLFILAMGTKKIAVGVSISAFVALFIESLWCRLLPLLRSCNISKEKENINASGGDSSAQIPPPAITTEADAARGVEKEEDEDADAENGGEEEMGPAEMAVPAGNQSSTHLVLLLIVLFGLVGGRFAAMAATVSLFSLRTPTKRLLTNLECKEMKGTSSFFFFKDRSQS